MDERLIAFDHAAIPAYRLRVLLKEMADAVNSKEAYAEEVRKILY